MWYLAGSDEQALTQQGNLRGWKEFQRNVHFLSAYHDLARFFAESDAIDGPDFLEQRTR